MSHLTDNQVDLQLQELDGWHRDDNAIVKTYKFESFIAAFSFMTQVAFHIQELEHHPEWLNSYDKVQVRLTTHDVNGISSNDIRLAKRMEKVYAPIKPALTKTLKA